MYQSFVTTAPTGLENRGDFDFSLCKARVYAWHCGDIFMVKVLPKALLRSWKVNVKLPRRVWAGNQKPCSSTALLVQCWAQSMALKRKAGYVPAIPGPIGARLTNDWCIIVKHLKFHHLCCFSNVNIKSPKCLYAWFSQIMVHFFINRADRMRIILVLLFWEAKNLH